MLIEWLSPFTGEGWIIINWWLLATIAGFTVLPLAFRLLGGLPDRGYALARPLGLLLIAVVFWLLAILGFVDNSSGSIILAWIIVLSISLLTYFSVPGDFDLQGWWREYRGHVLRVELLFAVLLLGWAIVRAHQNDFGGTEKPMDLAFMSAVQRSETFPPNDPWLSGYSISYYYMGYVMASMMSMMSGVWSTTGYNMHIAMLFALAGIAAYGVAYNLVRSRKRMVVATDGSEKFVLESQFKSNAIGILAMVFVVLLGNFHTPIVELPYRNVWFDDDYLDFWDTKSRASLDGRTEPIDLLDPNDSTFWWWFDASRSITERNLNDARVNEVIDEFPQFSFLLADSHPHVMALPYAILAIGLALNLLLLARFPTRYEILLYGVCAGSLVFLNTWDAPIYIALLVGADALRRLKCSGQLVLSDWLEMLVLGVALVGIMIGVYLPFLVGFQSQLAGILPNLLHPTRFQQIFVMFGPFILLLPFLLGVEYWRGYKSGQINLRFGGLVAIGTLIVLLLFVAVLLLAGRFNPSTWAFASQFVDQNGGWDAVTRGILERRIDPLRILTTIVLLIGIVFVVARLFPRVQPKSENENTSDGGASYTPSNGFVLLLVGVGLGLILIPEFMYLRDNFGTRMNTVFKFYYQAWVVFSLAGAYTIYTVFADIALPRPAFPVRAFAGVMLSLVLVGGLLYPVIGIYHRMFIETGRLITDVPRPLTLDGGSTLVQRSDYDVLMCLNDLVEGSDTVVLEATGGSYDDSGQGSGKTGALTGIPSVLGWQGHQGQWRGTAYASSVGSRASDIPQIYQDLRLDEVMPILERYSVDFILYGTTERNRYGSGGEAKFEETMEIVCESGDSRIYRVDTATNFVNAG